VRLELISPPRHGSRSWFVVTATVVCLICLGCLFCRSASAKGPEGDPCGVSNRPWIRFETPAADRTPPELGEIIRSVRSELALRQIDVCTEGRGAPPIASIQIAVTSADGGSVVIDVRDSVTEKQLSRALDLRMLPPDSRFLAIAVATDELLRASWVEIALRSAPPPRVPPPAVVMEVVSAELRSEPRLEVGTLLAFEAYGGGQQHLGVDLRAGYHALSRFTATLRLGLRQGSSTATPNGSVGASAMLAGVGVALGLAAPSRPFGMDLLVRLDAVRVSFLPSAAPGVLEHPSSGIAVIVEAGLAPWLALGSSVRLVADATLGVPVRPVQASDTGNQATGVAGLAFATGGGIAAIF
jgi:hypothetical protein